MPGRRRRTSPQSNRSRLRGEPSPTRCGLLPAVCLARLQQVLKRRHVGFRLPADHSSHHRLGQPEETSHLALEGLPEAGATAVGGLELVAASGRYWPRGDPHTLPVWRIVLSYLHSHLDPATQHLSGTAQRGPHVDRSLRGLLRLQGPRLPQRVVVRVGDEGENLMYGTIDDHGVLLLYSHKASCCSNSCFPMDPPCDSTHDAIRTNPAHPNPAYPPVLFTEVRGRGILRSPFAGSCIKWP